MTYPRQARSYGTRKQTGAQAKSALTQLLYYCTPERLAGFTAAGLASMFNVRADVAAEMLMRAREKRAGR